MTTDPPPPDAGSRPSGRSHRGTPPGRDPVGAERLPALVAVTAAVVVLATLVLLAVWLVT